METDEFFTIKEKDLLFSLYRKLLQLSGETPPEGGLQKAENTYLSILYRTTVSSVIYSV
mgnify:CR=1 FL=1